MLETMMWDSNLKNGTMQQLSSQISRENLKKYKLENSSLDLLHKSINENTFNNIEIVDITPICKLLYKMINLNNENNDIV